MGKKKAKVEEADLSDYYTMKEAAKILKCSTITLRRRIARNEARGLVLMDPFGQGRPLILKVSMNTFLNKRLEVTAKEFHSAPHLHV